MTRAVVPLTDLGKYLVRGAKEEFYVPTYWKSTFGWWGTLVRTDWYPGRYETMFPWFRFTKRGIRKKLQREAAKRAFK